MRNLLIIFWGIVVLSSCSKSDDEGPAGPDLPGDEERPVNLVEYNASTEGLRDYFFDDGYFDIGVAIAPESLDKAIEVELIKRHMNSLTAENAMKWSSIQPSEGNFNWSGGDKITNFAASNNMVVRGHTLCWHQQVPNWVFINNGGTASKELVIERLHNHIAAVVGRYKGKVYAWDVANEAIDDNGNFRNSQWYSICGKDYIFEAFRAARAADPDAKLFYNDYNATNTQKKTAILNLLKELQTENLVDGMGLQGHWGLTYPDVSSLKQSLYGYAALGLELQITELDVSTGSASEYNANIQQQQVTAYQNYFAVFREYKQSISSVTFWGLTDNHSWKNKPGSPDFPLLFDGNYNPKEPYFSVIDF